MKKVMIMLMTMFLLVVIAACGTEESGKESKEEKAVSEEKKAENKEDVVQDRVIKHLAGETTIQGTPEKVAVVMPWISDNLISLGISPYASVSAGPKNENFPWYLEEGLKNAKNIGWAVNADIEMMLSIEPDLILANKAFEKVYGDYSKIAPTVILDYKTNEEGMRDMRKTLLSVAEIVQKEEEAAKVIAEYDKFVEKAREKVAASIGEETVMFLRVTPKDFRYYSASNFEVLYSDLDLQQPAHFPDNSSAFAPLSLEMLPETNPDHIFLLLESEEKLNEVKQTPLWDTLTAVQKEQVYPVDYDLWFQGFGPIANKLIIEDAVEKLTK